MTPSDPSFRSVAGSTEPVDPRPAGASEAKGAALRDDLDQEKVRKKEEKKEKKTARPWQRYRALVDALKE